MTIRAFALTCIAVVICWIGILALVTRFSNTAPSVRVIFPSLSLIIKLPPVSILDKNSWSMTLQNRDPALVKKLYQSGAWLVLPSGLQGCLPLPSA